MGVRQWVKEGYKVAMVSRTASKLEAAAAENPGTLPVAADVTDPASLTAALTTIEQKLCEIHTVVYNAGLGVWATYENVTQDDCWICHRQGSPENADTVFGTRPWSEGNPLLLRHRRRWHRSSERGPRTERIENGS